MSLVKDNSNGMVTTANKQLALNQLIDLKNLATPSSVSIRQSFDVLLDLLLFSCQINFKDVTLQIYEEDGVDYVEVDGILQLRVRL